MIIFQSTSNRCTPLELKQFTVMHMGAYRCSMSTRIRFTDWIPRTRIPMTRIPTNRVEFDGNLVENVGIRVVGIQVLGIRSRYQKKVTLDYQFCKKFLYLKILGCVMNHRTEWGSPPRGFRRLLLLKTVIKKPGGPYFRDPQPVLWTYGIQFNVPCIFFILKWR